MTDHQAAAAHHDARPRLPPVGHTARRPEWPAGAAEACDAIKQDFPGWSAYYVKGSPSDGAPGYRATCPQMTYPEHPLYGETADALQAQINRYLDGVHDPPS